MVEFIKRSRQTATNQPIGVVRITNDDGGKFRADMAMARAVQGVADFSIKKAKEQFEQGDLEAAASQPIYERDENGKIIPNTAPNKFEKGTGFFGQERERSTQAQNLYNKRFAVATENVLNEELLKLANEYDDPEKFEEQALAYVSEQSALLGEDFDQILQAQYQQQAQTSISQYKIGKLKSLHQKAEQTAVIDHLKLTYNRFQDVENLLAAGDSQAALELMNVIEKDDKAIFDNNAQYTPSQRSNTIQESKRVFALGTILNIKQNTPNLNALRLTTLLDKSLRDGSYATEQFGEELIQIGLSPEQAVSLRAAFQDASPATLNNLAQRMSAIKDEEKLFADNLLTTSLFESNDTNVIGQITKSMADDYFSNNVVNEITFAEFVPGKQVSKPQQQLIDYVKTHNRLPKHFKTITDRIISGAEIDANQMQNTMQILFHASRDPVGGTRQIEGINNTALGRMLDASVAYGGDYNKVREHVLRFVTGDIQTRRSNYARGLQVLGIDAVMEKDGTLAKQSRDEFRAYVSDIVSDELNTSKDVIPVRFIDQLVEASFGIYGTLDNPDEVLKQHIRNNYQQTDLLFGEAISRFAPEAHFATFEDKDRFIEHVEKRIIESNEVPEMQPGAFDIPRIAGTITNKLAKEGFDLPVVGQVRLPSFVSAFTGSLSEPNIKLGDTHFLKHDLSSTVTEPRYFVVNRQGNYVQDGGDNMTIDFRSIRAGNLLKMRDVKMKAIQAASILQEGVQVEPDILTAQRVIPGI